ncbi:MAG: 6-pyruvoyl-tetrahydropterin synthase-related protein [Anaerolineae bacterium]
MFKQWRQTFDPGWLVAAVLPLIAILPTLIGEQVIATADGVFHVHRIFAASTLMQSGDWYPRWIPWFHLGYGYPVFNFYAPLATNLGGLLGVLGISAPVAYSLIITLFWMVGSVGVYALARRYLPLAAALLAALLWSYAPPALQAVWNIGSIAQIVATAIVPWLFLTLLLALTAPSMRRAGWLGLAFGAVLLAHQPTAVLAALFVIPGILISLWIAARKRLALKPRVLCVGGGLVLGAGMAMIFLLPMLLELRYIQIFNVATNTRNVLVASFLQPFQLFQQPTAPDLSDLNRSLPETIGLVNGILAALGLAGLLWKRRWRLALLWGLASGLVIFLVLDVSIEFWLRVPLMSQLRFPIRILQIGALFFALLGASSLLLVPRRWVGGMALVVGVIVVIAALPTIYPSRDLLDFSNLSAADFIRYETDTYSFGGTSYDEFKPNWGEKTPLDTPTDIDDYRDHPLRLRVYNPPAPDVVVQVTDTSFDTHAGQDYDQRFRQFYFPGWTATLDGAAVEVFPDAEFGLLTVHIPAGNHTLVLARPGTLVENVAPLLSIVSLIAALVLIFRDRHALPTPETTSRFSWQVAVLISGSVVVFALVNRFYIQTQTLWFRQQSPIDQPAAMQTEVNQRFGDAYELLGYTLQQDNVAPDEWLNITLYWRALREIERYFAYPPVVQLVSPNAGTAWATTGDFFIGTAAVKHETDEFISDSFKMRVYADAPPYMGYISVQLEDGQTHQPLPLADGSTRLLLPSSVRITGSGPSINNELHYRLGEQVELWCASVTPMDNKLEVALYWHTLGSLPEGVQTFVHGVDATGTLVGQGDGPLLGGQYAPADWLAGQNLVDRYIVPNGATVNHLEVGLFLPDGSRLNVTQDGQPIADNVITLPVEEQECSP